MAKSQNERLGHYAGNIPSQSKVLTKLGHAANSRPGCRDSFPEALLMLRCKCKLIYLRSAWRNQLCSTGLPQRLEKRGIKTGWKETGSSATALFVGTLGRGIAGNKANAGHGSSSHNTCANSGLSTKSLMIEVRHIPHGSRQDC